MKVNVKKILENRFVLYLVFFLALVTVFGYITTNNYSSVLLFILIAVLTKYFSNNMIIILGAAVIGSHFVSLLNGNSMFNNNVAPKPNPNIEGFENKKTKNTKSSSGSESSAKKSDKSGFANQTLSPASLDGIDNIPNLNNILSKDDNAKKKEKAYDMLENAFSNDTVKNTAGNTKELLNKQLQLMDQMKEITPILQQTMGLVNNLDISSLTNIANKVAKILPDDMSAIKELSNNFSGDLGKELMGGSSKDNSSE